jgi:hypothetical protein
MANAIGTYHLLMILPLRLLKVLGTLCLLWPAGSVAQDLSRETRDAIRDAGEYRRDAADKQSGATSKPQQRKADSAKDDRKACPEPSCVKESQKTESPRAPR